ncbi:MAG: gliding motility-associated C-terminal domain-containing protein [Saprospiraceae bacterium]
MKINYLLIAGMLAFQATALFSQPICPPVGFPDPGNSCPDAPILCENLDGYCSEINNNNMTQNFPGCPNNVLNNDEWFAFYAGTTEIVIQVTPSNCSPGQNMGLQGAIYSGCPPGVPIMDRQCACTTQPFILESINYVIGQIYWFVLDGCAGNVCDYSIDVLEGSTVGMPPNDPGAITAPSVVCTNTSSQVSIAPVVGATQYNFTLNPTGFGTISNSNNDNVATVNWGANAGIVELCVEVENACFANTDTVCKTIEIEPRPTAAISGSGILCFGSNDPVDLTINFTGDAPWTFVYTRNGVAQPPITTSNNPYILMVTQAGTYALQSITGGGANCVGTVSGSSSVTLTNMNITAAVTDAICGQSNGAINLSVSNGNSPYTFLWSNMATTEDLTGLLPGTYTVTVTDEDGCTEALNVVVNDDDMPFNITGTTTPNTTCVPGGNGDINVTVTPAGNYTYNWSNNETTQDLTDVEAGPYTVTVTFGVNCTKTATFTINNQPVEPQINATVVGTTCELSNGSITLSVTGGVTPYTYLWDNNETTQNLTNIPEGTYSVTVTGANDCTDTQTINVGNVNPPINVTGVVTPNTTCLPAGNGGINITVAPAGTYTYEWSNMATTQDISNVPPGTYSVTVTGQGACSQTAEFTIPDQPNEPQVNATIVNTTCDLTNGSITISVSGGVTPYTYAWDNNAVTPNLNNILAGSYTVTVTGGNGCSTTQTFTVSNNNPPFNINANIVANTTCLPPGNGSISLTVTPAGSYTFIWSTNATTSSITNQPAGSYSVTVSAGGTCTNEATFDIPDNPNEPDITFDITESTCELANGSINISVSGGVTPYTYLWSNNATTQDLNNLLAGSYSLTVTGANGCSSAISLDVANNNPPFNVNANITPNTNCLATGNGSISLTMQPPGAYTFVWDHGPTTQNVTGLTPGNYFVTVSAGGACTQALGFFVDDEPFIPQLTFTAIDPNCGLSNGSINLSVTGAIAPYTYFWSPGGQTTQDINNLPPDIYTVVVTSANGCTNEISTQLNNQTVDITVISDVNNRTSCLTNNGSIMLTVTPANATFLWSNNATTKNLTNLAIGTYTVTVSAGGNCTAVETFTIEDEREYPLLSTVPTAATCGFSNGSIDLEVFAGVPPFTYKWSNNATQEDLNNVPAGNYIVTVTTSLGCTATEFVVVDNELIPINISGFVADNNSCGTPKNGFIDIDIDPPGVYTYKWSNLSTAQDIGNLAAGFYTVTVTQGTCVATATFEVGEQLILPNANTAVIPAVCGQSNGGVTLSVNGGSSPYTFKWSTMATTQNLNNVPPGTYTVTVTDFYNCTTTATATVPNSTITPNITAVPTANTSCAAPNGALNITVTPTGPVYTYAWSNMTTQEDPVNLAPGVYTVTVNAGLGCTSSATFSVGNNTIDPVIDAVIIPSICGQSDGGINLSISSGLTPYTFAWSNMATSEDLSNILAGNYTVTVTDANGCKADSLFNVPNNSSTFAITGVATPLTSCTVFNGAIDLTVTPAGPYTYLWSNMATSQDLNNLTPGSYSVTVVETGTCEASATFIVADNRTYPSGNTNVTPEVCGLFNGSVNLTVAGGTTPYNFSWSNLAVTEDLLGVDTGAYTVTITGANGCTAEATAVVPESTIAFSLSGNTTPNTSCITTNGSVNLTVSPAGTYDFTWSNMATTEDISAVLGGSYTVTVSAGGTCTNTATFTVGSTTPSPLITEAITPALCGQSSGAINLTVSSGASPYGFSWSNAATSEDLNNLPSGNYSVLVTGANGCSSTAAFVVPENAITPDITAIVTANTSCVAPNGSVNISVTPTNLNYTFTWLGGQTAPSLNNLPAGTYIVSVNGGGACINADTFVVDNNTPSPQITGVPSAATCGQSSGSVNLSATGGVMPYFYNWSNLTFNEDLSGVVSGNYNVSVTDFNGCSTTATYTVPEITIIPVLDAVLTANTSCVTPNGAIDLSVTPTTLSYTYNWSSNQTTPDISILPSGDYTVTVNGGGACIAVGTYNVPNSGNLPVISGQQTNILCFGGFTGAVSQTITGGTPPLTIVWSPAIPGNPEDLSGIAAGTYSVTVTDPLGCSASKTYNITQPATPVDLNCVQTATVSIPGAIDGVATLTIGGGTPPYLVVWNPGGQQTGVPAGNLVLNNLAEGFYAASITDANGCSTNCGFAISQEICETMVGDMSNTLLSLCGTGCLSANYDVLGQFLDPDDVLQFILHEGSTNIIVNEIARNNKPEFCFNPATMQYDQTYYISAVAGDNNGSGGVLLTDYCTAIAPGTPIVFREIPVASIVPPANLNCVTDQVDLAGSASLNGATYSWSTGNGNILGDPNQPLVSVDAAGIYTLVVNVNGCTGTAVTPVADINAQPVASVQASPDDILDCIINQIVLAGTIEGSLDVNAIWLSGGSVFANGTIVQIDQPGIYEFVILDTLSLCTDTASIIIDEDLAYPPLFINPADILSCTNPSITLSGGSSLPGINFTWSFLNGTDTVVVGAGTSVVVSTPGNYILTGVDPTNSCTNSNAVAVAAVFDAPVADAGQGFSIDCYGESAVLDGSASTGDPDMVFNWTTTGGTVQSGSNTPTPTISQPGTYTLIVTNPGNGCTDIDQVYIAPEEPMAELREVQPPCEGDRGAIVIDTVLGGKPPLSYSINGGVTFTQSNVFNNLLPGDYTVIVEDALGCTTSVDATLVAALPFLISVDPEAYLSIGDSYQIFTTVSPSASQVAEVQWTPGVYLDCDTCLNPIATPPRTQRYRVQVISEAGCRAESGLLLIVDRRIDVYVPNVFTPDGDGNNDWFTIYANPKHVLNIQTLQVYDRWGSKVFERSDFLPNLDNLGWDGMHRGTAENPAVFVWYAELELADGTVEVFKGDVTLTR